MAPEHTPKSDRDLWQSLALARGAAPKAVSDLDFAAWLEGRLPEAEAARVDAAVTADSELRQAALELADILGKPLPVAPSRMAARAQALVGAATPGRSFGRASSWSPSSWLAALLPSFDDGFSLQRGVMAGAAVMIAAVGFMMGGGLGESFAQQKYAAASSTVAYPLGKDTSQQLNDLFTDSI